VSCGGTLSQASGVSTGSALADGSAALVTVRREFNSLAKSIGILPSAPIRTSANGRLWADSDICPLKLRHHHIRQEQ